MIVVIYVSSATMQTSKQAYSQVTRQEFCMVEGPRKSTELEDAWALTRKQALGYICSHLFFIL